MARKKGFWRGFAAGAGGAVLSLAAVKMVSGAGRRRIIRIEKSIQIGRPVQEVFQQWASLDWLKNASDLIRDIRVEGNLSHWTLQLDGRKVQWDAEVEQFIPNQAIGWKSVNGPKHTGRVTFGPIDNDTLIQVTMNYAPPSQFLRPLMGEMSVPLEYWVERVLRDFKGSLEGKGQKGRKPAVRGESENLGPGAHLGQSDLERATGTYGRPAEGIEPRFGGAVNPVDYTSPPEAKR